MLQNLHTTIFPQPCFRVYIRPEDIDAFDEIGLDPINGGSHIAQLRKGPQTIGLVTLNLTPNINDVNISFIEVAKNSKGRKYGQLLLTGIFDFAVTLSQERNAHMFVTTSGFTDKGKRSLLPALEKLSIEYAPQNVTFDTFQTC